jgi:hypothetical protein
MNEDEIKSAIEDVKKLCDVKMDGYKMVSLRSALRELKIEEQPVIDYVSKHGFTYCLDYTIAATDHFEGNTEKPSQDVCYWGPDQLKSRLDCLR